MKKIFESIYLFSKLTTSLVLFTVLIIMGYFFYTSYQNQDKVYLETKTQENKFEEEINNNSTQIKRISENLVKNQSLLSQIEKLLKNNSLKDDSSFNINEEFKIALEGIQKNINTLSKEIQSIKVKINKFDDLRTIEEDNTNIVYEKSINDLKSLILIKYENGLDFEDELNSLENIILPDRDIFIEKIRVIARKPYKGHYFLEDQFQLEMENYIKKKIEKNNNNFLYRIIMPYIKIEPSQYNNIKSNDSLLLINIKKLIKERQIDESIEKLKLLDEYEYFFFNTIEQSKIYLEFNKNLLELI